MSRRSSGICSNSSCWARYPAGARGNAGACEEEEDEEGDEEEEEDVEVEIEDEDEDEDDPDDDPDDDPFLPPLSALSPPPHTSPPVLSNESMNPPRVTSF